MSDINYPLPKKSLEQIARTIFTPIKNRDCFTCLCIAGTGRRTLLNFFLKERNFIKTILGNEFVRTIFVYINLDNAVDMTNESVFKTFAEALFLEMKIRNIKADRSETNDILSSVKINLEIVIKENFYVVFLLNDFEYLFHFPDTIFRNLESILAINKSEINFAFFSTSNIVKQESLSKLHNLKYAVTQNIHYQTILTEKESVYIIDKLAIGLKLTLLNKTKQLLLELCGGHPQLIKYSLYLVKELGELNKNLKLLLLSNIQLLNICNDAWRNFNEEEKQILIHVFKTGKIPTPILNQADFLTKTNVLILQVDKKYKIFCELFSQFVHNQIPNDKLVYDEKTSQIFLGAKSVGNKFTFQESKLLVYFIKNENKIISRDEVAQTLWGKNYIESYSDWSIDKLISVLRKKMNLIGFSSKSILTLKKRGFSFSNIQ